MDVNAVSNGDDQLCAVGSPYCCTKVLIDNKMSLNMAKCTVESAVNRVDNLPIDGLHGDLIRFVA